MLLLYLLLSLICNINLMVLAFDSDDSESETVPLLKTNKEEYLKSKRLLGVEYGEYKVFLSKIKEKESLKKQEPTVIYSPLKVTYEGRQSNDIPNNGLQYVLLCGAQLGADSDDEELIYQQS